MSKPQTSSATSRLLFPDLLWTGSCISFPFRDELLHSHVSCYLVAGSEKTVLIDTGWLAAWPGIERDVSDFLNGRPLDYVFVTHPELPHIGAIRWWFEKYPNCIGLGDIRDNDLYYPDLVDRFRMVKPGDRVDLGDRELVIVPALWRDLPTTLWAFETLNRVLFVADAFSFLHFHQEGQCRKTTSEQPAIDIELMRFFNEKALSWTQYVDVRSTYGELDRLLAMLKPKMIASAHGNLIDNLPEILPQIKESMSVFKMPEAAA